MRQGFPWWVKVWSRVFSIGRVGRLKALPQKVRDLYVQKALVYLAVKQANHLGRSVHAEDSDVSIRTLASRGGDG